ncbi:HAD-IA family hydrolase, partial [Streptomyces albogriseolus]|uniref:HAD-IA family hydrolase n=1 Tax=Streptomyces albogriseolus TaxID=1887 RepID=UPI0034610C00
EALAEPAGGPDRARAAVEQWQRYRGEVDTEVLDFVREVRAAGITVGLATNATDLLDADLTTLGLVGELDVVVNSSALGVHKPAPEYFQAACQALATPPARVLFVDDEDWAVRGARSAGLSAHRWGGHGDLRYLRAALAY